MSHAVRRALILLFSALAAVRAQTPRQETEAARRALLVLNRAYTQLPPPPIDEASVKALEDALRAAQFEVTTYTDLKFDALLEKLDGFQTTLKRGDVSLFYYAGYALNQNDNWLLPIDFAPSAEREISSAAYSFARIEQKLAAKSPLVSIFLLDANWGAPQLDRQAGFAQPTPSARSWILASARFGQITTATNSGAGLFTSALVKALSQRGLDLTDLLNRVRSEVESASKGGQEPNSWTSDPPKFYFHEPAPQAPRQSRNGRLNYVYIPAGTFWMGCATASQSDCKAEEKPRHLVQISKPFWIGQTEVTVQGYQWFKPNWKPKRGVTNAGRQGDYPVVNISWEEAQEFCAWTAKGGRLPTEAEWEYAARGGREGEVFPYSDLATSRDKANFLGKSGHDRFEELAPVGVFDPNGYNLYDMAGNVWEWAQDWFRADYYKQTAQTSPVRDPQGPDRPDKAGQRVVRGGSWNSSPDTHLRLSYRDSRAPGNNLGFRCVLPDSPAVRAAFVN